ncbi:hypothetical protein N7468_003489 [Penicillium chermesinum]|uniref:LCCL domain-containing protein n=1 Tax=Penicillium chermesinum TaxID=63820 RepID=A0A9W9TRN6_9EURO|nr:uncharacterized protein N7468_003489 [Penicillium chermesinum]KAJ5238870.1 hypothetical protein N7468_003489 [Penicillium chermesinum]
MSEPEPADPGDDRPSTVSPEKRTPRARYTDQEDPESQRARVSKDDFDDDLELGNLPLLPGDPARHGQGDGESDFDFDIESEDIQFRHDPSFSCSPAGFVAWLRGPSPPDVYHINPWFPKWQAAPARLVERWVPSKYGKIGLVLGVLVFWIGVFFSLLQASVAGEEVAGLGKPVKLLCHDRLWRNATNCGLDGDLCRPFEEQSFAFRCPAGCAASILLEPYWVGDQELNYQPLVVGGKPFRMDGVHSGSYRGDSSICASALHAGMISDAKGGCAILHRKGARDRFPNATLNGVQSVAFDSYFPFSFQLSKNAPAVGSEGEKPIECSDIRWQLFAFTLVWTTIISMTVTSAPVFYSLIYFIVWFQVAMASDPPTSDFLDRVSIGLGRFLPGALAGFVIYYFCVRHTLAHLDAHAEKTVLWLGGCWVGALNADTFDRIPISRLTPHDIQQQPGAVTALIIIVSFLVVVFFLQAHAFRREGRFFPLLRLYGLFALGIVIFVAVPKMNLRIHHYIISLLLLPGTAVQTRPSLLFSGILVGLFINGIARWGFDSILQTPAALLDGAKLGTPPPVIDPPTVVDATNIVFKFPELPPHVDGISVLVNDVQRYLEFKAKDAAIVKDFAWKRVNPNLTEYLRFGYAHLKLMGGTWYEDFTPASSWAANGTFYYHDV